MFYDFEAINVDGENVKMDKYKGKVVLVVNTATECGFTPQYEDLERLYKEYFEKGLEVAEFPCNQFGGQAPGTDEEITGFCTLRFGTEYDRYKKVDVNGENAHPLFIYLQNQIGFGGFDLEHRIGAILDKKLSEADPNYKNDPSIKWNFTKFLIDRNGKVVARFEPTTDMKKVEEEIKALL